jgi:predicted nucleic-acid-binding protein
VKTVLIDSNILLRFFLKDNVVVAETVWVLTSFYKKPKKIIVPLLEKFISQAWVINPKKELLMEALNLYLKTNIGYIDCWAYVSSKDLKIELKTFDRDLEKFSRAT